MRNAVMVLFGYFVIFSTVASADVLCLGYCSGIWANHFWIVTGRGPRTKALNQVK
jgi:hypothetical protein